MHRKAMGLLKRIQNFGHQEASDADIRSDQATRRHLWFGSLDREPCQLCTPILDWMLKLMKHMLESMRQWFHHEIGLLWRHWGHRWPVIRLAFISLSLLVNLPDDMNRRWFGHGWIDITFSDGICSRSIPGISQKFFADNSWTFSSNWSWPRMAFNSSSEGSATAAMLIFVQEAGIWREQCSWAYYAR